MSEFKRSANDIQVNTRGLFQEQFTHELNNSFNDYQVSHAKAREKIEGKILAEDFVSNIRERLLTLQTARDLKLSKGQP